MIEERKSICGEGNSEEDESGSIPDEIELQQNQFEQQRYIEEMARLAQMMYYDPNNPIKVMYQGSEVVNPSLKGSG